jgi:hypothetical protein
VRPDNNDDEPSLFHIHSCGLLFELGLLPGVSKYRPSLAGDLRVSAVGTWAGDALFCVAGAVTRPAHRSISRPLRLDVAVRVAAGADVFGSRVLSPAALRRGVRGAVYSDVFFDCPPGTRGPAFADRCARRGFRAACHAQYFGVRGLRAVVRVERDLSRGRTIVAKPQAQQRGVALAIAGTARADEPLKRARGRHFHRHWYGPRIHMGRPAHRSILVLRSQICDHAGGVGSLFVVLPAGAQHRMAWRARFETVRVQFFRGGNEFHGCELVSIAQSQIFLGAVLG